MQITKPYHAYSFFRPYLQSQVEEFWAVALNSEKRVIAADCLFRGTVDFCPFHPRDVFRFAFRHNASALLVAHNHPTGEPKPSREDIAVTRQLIKASEFMQIPVVDHLILAHGGYFSFLEAGWISTAGFIGPDGPSLG